MKSQKVELKNMDDTHMRIRASTTRIKNATRKIYEICWEMDVTLTTLNELKSILPYLEFHRINLEKCVKNFISENENMLINRTKV